MILPFSMFSSFAMDTSKENDGVEDTVIIDPYTEVETVESVSAEELRSFKPGDLAFYFEKNGYRIAVICDGLWNYWQETDIINRIHEAEKQSDFQIVYWHGGTEYRHSPEQWQIDASHDIVDAGADLVIGNHAHVLQPKEVYNGVTIVYSLGNFCYGGMITCENRTVIYQLRLTVGENGVILGKEDVIIPCYVYTGPRNNFQPAPITDPDEKQRVLDFMNGLINSPV